MTRKGIFFFSIPIDHTFCPVWSFYTKRDFSMTANLRFSSFIAGDWRGLIRALVFGALPALAFISFFLMTAGEPDPQWSPYWRIRPLLVVPLAGMAGGVLWWMLTIWRARSGAIGIIARIMGVLGYLVAVWMGLVLGLVGTYWH